MDDDEFGCTFVGNFRPDAETTVQDNGWSGAPPMGEFEGAWLYRWHAKGKMRVDLEHGRFDKGSLQTGVCYSFTFDAPGSSTASTEPEPDYWLRMLTEQVLQLRQIRREANAKMAFETACFRPEEPTQPSPCNVVDVVVNGELHLSETFEKGWDSDGSVKKPQSDRVDTLHASWEVSGYPHRKLSSTGELEIDEEAERAAERAAARGLPPMHVGKRKTRCDCPAWKRNVGNWGCDCNHNHVRGCRCLTCIHNDDWCF